MKIFIYLDESGQIHKNAKTKFFAVGGYFVSSEEKNKITSKYKKQNLFIKRKRNIKLEEEVKSYDYKLSEKIDIFKIVQEVSSFCGCAIIFEKLKMQKKIIESNLFFNYAVKILINDCILPIINYEKNIEFYLNVDNRNLKIKDLNLLEEYLNREYKKYNYNFKVKYYDSKYNYGIQLADLIVNTFYNSYKDINIVKEILKIIDYNKFRISMFPSYVIKGKIS